MKNVWKMIFAGGSDDDERIGQWRGDLARLFYEGKITAAEDEAATKAAIAVLRSDVPYEEADEQIYAVLAKVLPRWFGRPETKNKATKSRGRGYWNEPGAPRRR